ncbi:LysR family transcriptional regulator [Novosphingobium sp. FSY-8]|uniref:LysR family transcriptional regulator n=1 Tax=Novosphingobium ovatum TaxID=1908523 RepID=A0ABW9XHV7_9SPHN|nr:LysR family transcriptional regulator [Novosphingobium ovatum]NBC38160.1 LysR family transcriptional regulator [Novosphingobium ovatum]
MEIQQLRHFLAVVRHGSIGQAAEALNLSQPGLSRSIRALEEVLGLALFERKARGVSLTEHGRKLMTRAEVIVNEHDRAMAEARSAGSLRSGDVRLGIHTVLREIGAGDALSDFIAANPAIGLCIDVGPGSELVEKVASAELDIAFTLFPIERSGNIAHFEHLFHLACRIYQRVGAARPITGITRLGDLMDRAWALSGAVNFRRAFEENLIAQGLPFPQQFLQSSSLGLVLDLVQQRDLLTILPERVANAPRLAGRLESCDAPAPAGGPAGGLVYRKEVLRLPAVRAVADAFRNLSTDW